ncbi:hypothetical protein NLO88_17885 [Pseudomonas syringae]|nr:hypothetical protein [Pseudomonas syringae]
MDLLTPLYDQGRLHSHFRTISDGCVGSHYQREELLRWLNGFPDRDNKFVKEFQTTFNSSFWEIYLHAAFREYGFSFDWSHPAPDFLLSAADLTFTVEATTSNHAVDAIPEWGRPLSAEFYGSVDFNELNRVAIIRLANAFISKSQKFQDKYQHHPHVKGRPFVLAVAPFEQPGFTLQAYRAIEALLFDYYVDEAEYLANPGRFPNGLEGKSLGSVQKDNGAEIELGFFDCPRFSHISAVVFSNLATWGKVDAMCGNPDALISTVWSLPDGEMKRTVYRGNEMVEGITDGLRVYHNPYATIPLPLEVFRREGVVQMWADRADRSLISEQTDNCLQSRSAMTFFVNDDDPSLEA